jgi:hypothetical protein
VNEGRASLVRAWLSYAGVGLAVVGVAAGGATLLLEAEAARAVQVAAAIAYVLQLGAFAALLAFRGRDALFLAGYLGGMVLRFGGLGVVAWWLGTTTALPRAAVLISLAAFLFVLLLLEPIFLRRGIRTT